MPLKSTLSSLVPIRLLRFRKGTAIACFGMIFACILWLPHFNAYLEKQCLGDMANSKSALSDGAAPSFHEKQKRKDTDTKNSSSSKAGELDHVQKKDAPKKMDQKPNEVKKKDETELNVAPMQAPPTNPTTPFVRALQDVSYKNRTVLLSLVDEGFVTMAINFYLTSIKPHKIENYLILTMHNETCRKLAVYKINCFKYRDCPGGHKSDEVGTPQFIEKMNVRTDMMIEALQAGISVLHSDTDVIFMKSPFYHIPCKVGQCDLAALKDYYHFNAGFLYANPSALSVYTSMKELSLKDPTMNDQVQLNRVIGPRIENKTIRFVALSEAQFQSGKLFYADGRRVYADSMKACSQCVVVHNNWIVGLENKIYRAKELHQWLVNYNRYYTNTTRKYITYNNTKPYTKKNQIMALQSALAAGRVLNRTVILPKIYCNETIECGLNSLARMKTFDPVFSGKYREHSFLTHPLVPSAVKKSVKKTSVKQKELTDKDVMESFGGFNESVLALEHANFTVTFSDREKHKTFEGLIHKGLTLL